MPLFYFFHVFFYVKLGKLEPYIIIATTGLEIGKNVEIRGSRGRYG